MVDVRSAAGWIGFGGVAWAAGQAVEGRAFMQAAAKVNAQIGDDIDYLARHGRLPDTPPALPLHGGLVASKPRIMAKCFAGGAGIAFLSAALLSFPVLASHQPTSGSPMAQAIFGALVTGFGSAILLGWLIGAVLWIVFGAKENARRSANVVLQHFQDYWREREQARLALTQGADFLLVGAKLRSYHIADEPDEVLVGSELA